jgi:error-prone DNA polymerase
MNKLPLFAHADSQAKITKQDDHSYLNLPTSLFGEQIAQDYAATGLSLKGHPVDNLKAWFEKDGWQSCSAIDEAPHGRRLRLIGLVTMRQRPGTAKGTVFVTLEDSLVSMNVIVWPHIVERDRTALLGAHLMGVYGRLQRQGPISHFIAESVHNCDSYWEFLQASDQQVLLLKSRNFY